MEERSEGYRHFTISSDTFLNTGAQVHELCLPAPSFAWTLKLLEFQGVVGSPVRAGA